MSADYFKLSVSANQSELKWSLNLRGTRQNYNFKLNINEYFIITFV